MSTALEMTVNNIQDENNRLRARLSALLSSKSAEQPPSTTDPDPTTTTSVDYAHLGKLQAELATAKATLIDREMELTRAQGGGDEDSDRLRRDVAQQTIALQISQAEVKSLHSLIKQLRSERDNLARQKDIVTREIEARRILRDASGEAPSLSTNARAAGVERALLELRGMIDSVIRSWDQVSTALEECCSFPRRRSCPAKSSTTAHDSAQFAAQCIRVCICKSNVTILLLQLESSRQHQEPLEELPCGERNAGHGYDLYVADAEAHEEAPPSVGLVDCAHSLSPVNARAAAGTSNLHATTDDFEGIAARLADEPRNRSAEQIPLRWSYSEVRDITRQVRLERSVRQKRHTSIGDHAEQCHRESSIERVERQRTGEWRNTRISSRLRVDGPDGIAQSRSLRAGSLISHAHSHELHRVGQHDGGDTRGRSRQEEPARCPLVRCGDQDLLSAMRWVCDAYLLDPVVEHELDASIREHAEQSGGVALEQAQDARCSVNLPHGVDQTRRRTCGQYAWHSSQPYLRICESRCSTSGTGS